LALVVEHLYVALVIASVIATSANGTRNRTILSLVEKAVTNSFFGTRAVVILGTVKAAAFNREQRATKAMLYPSTVNQDTQHPAIKKQKKVIISFRRGPCGWNYSPSFPLEYLTAQGQWSVRLLDLGDRELCPTACW
jgi:hypothetical protein